MNISLSKRTRIVHLICLLIFIIALAPVLSFRYFPTVDGPSHLYNASIIRELWFGDSDVYNTFFEFNPQPVPNWSGHFLAVISGIFFPVWLVEKILVLLIAIGIPFGVLKLLKTLSVAYSWNILLLLPFTYTLLLYLGFFNFMIGVVLMLTGISWMIKWQNYQNAFYLLRATIFLTLIYFSHVLAFGLTLAFTFLWVIWGKCTNRKTIVFSKVNFQKLICFIPGLILSVWFYSSRKMSGFRNKLEQLPAEELWKMLKEGTPLAGLNGAIEGQFTSAFILGLGILLVFHLFWRIKNKIGFQPADLLFIFSLLLLVMYFAVPDGMASGGFISLRLLYLTLLFAVIWILIQKSLWFISFLTGALGAYVCFSTFTYRMDATAHLSANAANITELVSDVKQGSVVLPLNYSGNWLHINLSGYAGATRKIVILDNYEAVTDVFPLLWKVGQAPEFSAGNFAQSLNPEITIEKYEKATGNKIDYVSRWQFNENSSDKISLTTDSILRNHFNTKLESGDGDLFFNAE